MAETQTDLKLPDRVRQECAQAASSPLHGWEHWMEVARTGVAIQAAHGAVDGTVVWCFALLHDSKRLHDGVDADHGRRASLYVKALWKAEALPINVQQMKKLYDAVRFHADGEKTDDLTIGACWDADRLQLGRVGITPSPSMMSTAAGRTMAKRGGR